MKALGITLILATAAWLCGCSGDRTPESHYATVRKALTRLMSRPEGAFVIIEEARSGKFVQFAGSTTEALTLDLPLQALSPAERDRAKALFSAHGHPGPVTYEVLASPAGAPVGQQSGFVCDMSNNLDRASRLAVAVLHEVYGFDPAARLKVTEE